MNKFVRCLLFVLTLLAVVPGFAETFVAVMETLDKTKVLNDGERVILTDKLRERAMKMLPAYRGFVIMTEGNIRAMLPPDKDVDECVNEECLVETGRNIFANYIAQADVVKFSGQFSASVKMYDTKSGSLVGSFIAMSENALGLLVEIEKKADDMFAAIAGGNGVGQGAGGADGIVGVNMGGSGFKLEGSQSYILKVSSEPSGAMVVVDGRAKCKQTPCNVELPSGEHRFSFSLDRYFDKDTIFAVDRGGLSLMTALLPNFGVLDVSPKLVSGVGENADLNIEINGTSVKKGRQELAPGSYKVTISHRCYEPAEFSVVVKNGSNLVFDRELLPLKGGLKLSATENDEPVALPVYIGGQYAGETPLLKEVAVCSKVEIGSSRKTVDVKLKANETVEYNYATRSYRSYSSSSSNRYYSSSSRVIPGSDRESSVVKGTMKDPRDGQTYKTVKIGDQTWMAENLNYKVKPGKQSWCYDNKDANCKKYGRLYTWAAAVGKSEERCGYGKDCNLSGRVQGVCPSGWHLPSKQEFETLREEAGGYDNGGKILKSKSGWILNGNGTDGLGFSALPAGNYYNGGFHGEGYSAYFWSSTEDNSLSAYNLGLGYDSTKARMNYSLKDNGFSVRCLKN